MICKNTGLLKWGGETDVTVCRRHNAGAKKFQGQAPTFMCSLCRLEDYFLPEGAFKNRHLGFFSGVNKMTHTNDTAGNLLSRIKVAVYGF